MKNKLWIGFTLGITVMLGVAATSYDIQKGFDFTSVSGITAARLNQLVDNALVATNRGMIIYTNSPPTAGDVAANPRLARFIWLDSTNAVPVVNTWNTDTLAWQASGLAANSVYSTNIVNSTIVADDIAAGAIENAALAADAVSNVKIVDDAVTSGKILNETITTSDVLNRTLLGLDIATNTIAGQNLTLQGITGNRIAIGAISSTNMAADSVSATNLAINSINTSNIVASAVALTNISVSAGSAHQALRVDSAGTAPEWVNPGILQIVGATWTNQTTCTATLTHTAIPAYAAANQLISLSITPKSASSRLLFHGTISGNPNTDGRIAMYITKEAAGNSLATTHVYTPGGGEGKQLSIQYIITNSSTAATSYQLLAGTTPGIYTNNASSVATPFGDTLTSSFTITEILD